MSNKPLTKTEWLASLEELWETAQQPRPWVGLTASTTLNMMPGSIPAEHDGALMDFARAIEAKLKERNT